MTTVLVASASVHTTAAACDYLSARLDADDAVVVLGVLEPDIEERDLDDAGNVARTRLIEPTVDIETRADDPVESILTVADDVDADSILIGAVRGDPAAAGDPPGSTVQALLASARRPVTVVPVSAP
ncbi:MAG: universal stress protein [Salinirussus sp.]